VRVQARPSGADFAAIGMSPTVIAYNEVYNHPERLSRGENEAAGVESMKFYESAQSLHDEHAITIRRSAFREDFPQPAGTCGAILRRQGGGAYGRQ